MSQTHPFKPIFDQNSKILILGSFPSAPSRKLGFYYANPQNRFWRPANTDEKIKFLLARGIAVYDAAICCEIKGSSDAKMTAVVPANLEPIFSGARIAQVFANGGKAHEICEKHLKTQILNATGKEPVKLPSTSPANANFNFERLVREWTIVADVLNRAKI